MSSGTAYQWEVSVMNLTGNGDIKDEYLEIITHRHSGPIKRQANNYRLVEREGNKNESVRNRK